MNLYTFMYTLTLACVPEEILGINGYFKLSVKCE